MEPTVRSPALAAISSVLLGLPFGSACAQPDVVTPPWDAGLVESPGEADLVAHDAAIDVWSAHLANGIVVHHRHMPGTGIVAIRALVNGGALLEQPEQRGLTEAAVGTAWANYRSPRLTPEHLAGLTVRSDARVDGAKLYVDAEPDRFQAAVAATWALLESPRVERADLAQWRQAALAARTTPEATFRLLADSAILGNGQLAARAGLASVNQLAAAEPDQAQAWLRHLTHTEPIEIGIAGDIEPHEALETAAAWFGTLPDRPRPHAGRHAELRMGEPPASEARGHARTPNGDSIVMLAFFGPDLDQLDDFRAMRLATRIVDQRAALDLAEVGITPQAMRMTVSPGLSLPGRGMAWAHAQLPGDQAGRAARIIDAAFRELATEGPTQPEIDRAAAQTIADLESRLAEPRFWAEVLAQRETYAMPMPPMDEIRQAYRSITPVELRDRVAKYITNDRRVIVLLEAAEAAEARAIRQLRIQIEQRVKMDEPAEVGPPD
ncbi:MAG: insulinase family protein [Planctomycetota bacterium]